MKKLGFLIGLVIALLFFVIPEAADGRGARPGGGGRGAGTDTGGGGGGTDTGGSPGSGGPPPTAPESTGPTEVLGAGNNADAPKDPANAIRDELRLHADRCLRQCAADRSWSLLWRAFGDGRMLVNARAAACAQAEHPAEKDDSSGKDAPSGDSAGAPGK